jgi:hypothetical protein
LLIDTTATAHLPGPQNPAECHLYFAEGRHIYIALTALTAASPITWFWKISASQRERVPALSTRFFFPLDVSGL